MIFVYIVLMVGVVLIAWSALSASRTLVLIYQKMSTGPTDNTEAVARIEAAAAKLSTVESKVRQQSEAVTGIEPVQP